MTVSIEPFSALDQQSIRRFLVQQGNDSSAIVDWKYFDNSFHAGQERGFACLQNGKISGAVGLIPFAVSIDGRKVQAAWSCDWYRDSELAGPLGIMLLKQSVRSYPIIYSLGGSPQTREIMPRLSQLTALTAGVELHKPIRLGGAIRAFAKLGGWGIPHSLPVIDDLPLHFSLSRVLPASAQLSGGIGAALDPVLYRHSPASPVPAYDAAYLHWLLGRCPAIESGVCTAPAGSDSSVAVLFWRLVEDQRFWRLALLGDLSATPWVTAALNRALQHIKGAGGWMTSILISRLDVSLFRLLRRFGFIAGQRRPLYILNRPDQGPLTELRQLSYLDTDYAYRFTFLRS